jgi:hypothetical protein
MTIIQEILLWAACIIAIEAATEIEVESQLFAGFRGGLSRIGEGRKGVIGFIFWYLHGLFSCGYCLSVWVAAGAALVIPTRLPWPEWYFMVVSFIIKLLVLHRLSNIWHEAVYRWLGRMPFILGFSPVDTDPTILDTGEFNERGATDRTEGDPERIGIEGDAPHLPPEERSPRTPSPDGGLRDLEDESRDQRED